MKEKGHSGIDGHGSHSQMQARLEDKDENERKLFGDGVDDCDLDSIDDDCSFHSHSIVQIQNETFQSTC